MKVTENSTFINLDAYTKNIEKKDRPNDVAKNITTGSVKNDEVVLSPVATKISESKKAIDLIPDTREAKIAELKNQIENGSYKVNNELVASKMVEESLFNDLLI